MLRNGDPIGFHGSVKGNASQCNILHPFMTKLHLHFPLLLSFGKVVRSVPPWHLGHLLHCMSFCIFKVLSWNIYSLLYLSWNSVFSRFSAAMRTRTLMAVLKNGIENRKWKNDWALLKVPFWTALCIVENPCMDRGIILHVLFLAWFSRCKDILSWFACIILQSVDRITSSQLMQ